MSSWTPNLEGLISAKQLEIEVFLDIEEAFNNASLESMIREVRDKGATSDVVR